MKVRCNRDELAEALAAACTVTPTRTPKPILECVRLQVRSDELVVSATDLELSVRYVVRQVEVEETGDTVVKADTFNKIVRESSDELLGLELVESMLHVRGADSHFQIHTQNPGEFPPVAMADGEPDFSVECQVLRRLIEWTVFASARESTRYAINGILWEIQGEELVLVATDGRRLSCARGPFEPAAKGKELYIIVPAKALQLTARVPADADAPVNVRLSGSQLLLEVGAMVLGTSLVEGHFPKYQDVIPSDNDKLVELGTAQFQGALRRAALLTNEESKGVRLAFSEGNLILSSRAPEQGEATVSLAIEYGGEPVEIGFNPAFLLDVLRVVHGETVTFSFKEPNRPGVVRADESLLHVVMPVSLV
jgi:DNA polymerase-3 subunit beta